MKNTIRLAILLCAAMSLAAGSAFAVDITSAATGNWSSPSTWTGGVVPTGTDNVEIDTAHTVTIDIANAVCNNLIVKGYLFFDIVNSGQKLTVNGNATVAGERPGRLRSGSGTPTAPKAHELELKGSLTVESGASFDMRVGSGANVSVGRVVFSGSANSVINLSSTTYISSLEEFNTVVIKKSGNGKVVLASGNLFQNNNSTNSPDTLILESGIVETGTNHWVILRTSSAAIVGASPASYINGFIGRGITNGGGLSTTEFPVGDDSNYRPLNVRVVGPANATGHYVWAKLRSGNANTGSSTLSGGIDRVSAVRYFELGYLQNAGTAASMGFYGFGPSYGNDDGVSSGNTDLRAAYSTNARATWMGHGPSDHTTTLASPPTVIRGYSLTTSITLPTGSSLFVALARLTGTTTNSLGIGTSVVEGAGVPSDFYIAQNYPNPFNPSTTIEYGLPAGGHVVLSVFNMLGQKVATLADEAQVAGVHRVQFEATSLPSGVYFYHLSANGFEQTRRMMFLK